MLHRDEQHHPWLRIPLDAAETFARTHYGINVRADQLPGEVNANFRLTDDEGNNYLFKIVVVAELDQLTFQLDILSHLDRVGIRDCQKVLPSVDGKFVLTGEINGTEIAACLLTWIHGRVLAQVNPHSPEILYQLGTVCGRVHKALADFDHPTAHRFIKWNPSTGLWVQKHRSLFNGVQRAVFDECLDLVQHTFPALDKLRQGVNHNDANDYNVIVSGVGDQAVVVGLLDFGDAIYTHTINELAIVLTYAMMNKPDPVKPASHVIKGYHRESPLMEEELSMLFPLIIARLLISVTCSAMNRKEHPDNSYLQVSDSAAWTLLERLHTLPPALVHFAFRSSCGLSPCPLQDRFNQWVATHHLETAVPVVGMEDAPWLDLSVGSADLGTMGDLLDADRLDKMVERYMVDCGYRIALGRYNEVRAFYSTEAFVTRGNDGPSWRTVHIALDVFAPVHTDVVAVLDGVVFSAHDNAGDRDYGPTIILEHTVSADLKFYTLYGHLSRTSLENLKPGTAVHKGQVIGKIGSRTENGQWPPHLHFQVVLDLLGKVGDFPGVADYSHLDTWMSISPDPWTLLFGDKSQCEGQPTRGELSAFRQQHLGKNLSTSYRVPLVMMRGHGAYLLDHTGRRYLDTVNNVAHVGHEHPRVVRAGQRQMSVINTNTRYLHPNLVSFVEELLSTFPRELSVAYLVNSGSEANELALRLARTYTGRRDMLVSEIGYHGNTTGCVEVSSYKFDGPGGSGPGPNVHVFPIPDAYRGRYAESPDPGRRYAAQVSSLIEQLSGDGRQPAALLLESVISCGGQVMLPPGFLGDVYNAVRGAGGVCIADEVQTGCGRMGEFYWAYEAYGVVPDIVTIGKPIGNGHPLGAVVTTQSIASAFANGMEYFNTFGGNPVSCAIGKEVLRIVKEEGLQQNAAEVGQYLINNFTELMMDFPIIGDVRGSGLFLGIEMVVDKESKTPATDQVSYFINRMRDKGILMSSDGPYHNVLKIKPPMVFTKSHGDFLIETMLKVLKEDAMRL